MEAINETLVESLKIIEPAETVEQSLARVLKAQAEEKRRAICSLIKYFQQRYNMSVEEFYLACISDKRHSWEEERYLLRLGSRASGPSRDRVRNR